MPNSIHFLNFKNRKFKGFTLAELIVVITIFAILATIGFLALSGYSQDAKDSAIKANVRSVQTAISSEAALTNNSPRYYVVHDTGAALSGAVAYVDGNPTALTGWDWNVAGTNYSAGNPDYVRLKMNPEKFKVSASGLRGTFAGVAGLGGANAAYDARYLTVGAMDAVAASTNGGKKRAVSYFQVVGISPVTGTAVVAGNYPTSSGSVAGLVKDPKTTSTTGALVDGWNSSLPPSPVNGACGSASKGYAFSASSFGSDAFCSAGTASPVSPAFPAAGGSVSWTCSALNGGNAPACTATHAAAANCSASTQTVNGRTYSVGAVSNGATLAASSSSNVTGGTQAYSQTFVCADGAVTVSGAETAGAVACSADFGLNSNVCVPKSCRIQKEQVNTSSVSGNYSIDPDGTGGSAPFTAYCDMATDGGGWTLVAVNGLDGRPALAGRIMVGGTEYGDVSAVAASVSSIRAGVSDATIKNFSMNAKTLFTISGREALMYVGGGTKDYVKATLPASCNVFDSSVVCPESNGPFTVYRSNGTVLTTNGYACNSSPTDSYNEFGLHVLDGIDNSSLQCHATSTSSWLQGIGRIYTTFNQNSGTYWTTGVHSHWNTAGAYNTAGYLMIR